MEQHKKFGLNREIKEVKRSLDGLYAKDYLRAGQGSRNSFNLTSNQNLNTQIHSKSGDNSQVNIQIGSYASGGANGLKESTMSSAFVQKSSSEIRNAQQEKLAQILTNYEHLESNLSINEE